MIYCIFANTVILETSDFKLFNKRIIVLSLLLNRHIIPISYSCVMYTFVKDSQVS